VAESPVPSLSTLQHPSPLPPSPACSGRALPGAVGTGSAACCPGLAGTGGWGQRVPTWPCHLAAV